MSRPRNGAVRMEPDSGHMGRKARAFVVSFVEIPNVLWQ